MGFDLQFLATSFRDRGAESLSTASLRLERERSLLSQLTLESVPCLVQPLPADLKIGHYEDDGIRFDEYDRYGKPLTFTTPEQLRAVQRVDELCQWNRAVLAFALGLPPGSRIVLYWC